MVNCPCPLAADGAILQVRQPSAVQNLGVFVNTARRVTSALMLHSRELGTGMIISRNGRAVMSEERRFVAF